MGIGSTSTLKCKIASTGSKDPTPPSSLTPPSIHMRAPSPPLIFMGDISIMTIDSSLHDLIGECNDKCFDNQQLQEGERDSSCEELEEDEIKEGAYAYDEERTLEELWWPAKVLHNVGSLQSSTKNICVRGKIKVET
jgi:hypothetical protein